MRLNADIVFDHLPESLSPRMQGVKESAMRLRRPELYETGCRELEPDHLYVIREERLPQRVTVGKGCVIVCIGNSARLRWFAERCCVITISGSADFYAVFNTVQRIFQHYDLWEDTLYNIISDDASVEAMLEASQQVIPASMLVVDAMFGCVAAVGKQAERAVTAGGGETVPSFVPATKRISVSSMDQFLATHDPSTEVSGAFRFEFEDMSTINVNLIDDEGYHGCLTVIYPDSEPKPGDSPTIEFLASLVLRALRQQGLDPDSERSALRDSLRAIVSDLPLDAYGKAALQAASERGTYVCVRLKLAHKLRQIPLAYVHNLLEADIAGTVAFEYRRSSLVAFVRLDDLAEEGSRRAALEQMLMPLLRSMEMRAGMSDHVGDLLEAKAFFLQASIALENGTLLDPDASPLYKFQDYALAEMVVNSIGQFPIEMFYTSGLRKLVAHDAESPTSYIKTLKCFLDHNMNVTHTAKALYLHRSTLIERMERIRELLGDDLSDPDVRLRLALVFKAIELHDDMQDRFEERSGSTWL